MKKSELQQIIKEEIVRALSENTGKPITLSPKQEKMWFEAVQERFEMFQEDEGYEEALSDLPQAVEDVLANILSGFDPLEDEWVDGGDWDKKQRDTEDMTHPYNKLTSLGYDIKAVAQFAKNKYKEFKKMLS
jgi:hypothetical protein